MFLDPVTLKSGRYFVIPSNSKICVECPSDVNMFYGMRQVEIMKKVMGIFAVKRNIRNEEITRIALGIHELIQ